jgi:hypothetical protein
MDSGRPCGLLASNKITLHFPREISMNTQVVSMCFLAPLLSTFCIALPGTAAPATLEESIQVSDIDSVSNELLAREIEFLKLNTRLKLFLLPHSAWAARRSSGCAIANYTLTSVGAFTNGWGRLHYLYTPGKAPSPLFEDAGIVRFLANCVSTGSAAFEFCNDSFTDLWQRKHGVSLSTMHDRALVLQHEISELIDRRQSLLSSGNFKSETKTTLDKESLVFNDLYNAEANEFAFYFSQAKGNTTLRRIGYLISVTSNVTSGAGTLTGIEANHLHGLKKVRKNHMGGVGGICDIVSGSMNVLAPIATRSGAAIERHFSRNAICKGLNCQQSNDLFTLLADERANVAALPVRAELEVQGVVLRSEPLRAAANILEKRYSMRLSEQKAARNRFLENMATATVAGGSKIANGVGGAVGAFEFPRDSYHRFEVLGGTAIAYGAGNSLAALETARVRLADEFKTHQAQKNKTSKEEILNRQLKELEMLKPVQQIAGNPDKKAM